MCFSPMHDAGAAEAMWFDATARSECRALDGVAVRAGREMQAPVKDEGYWQYLSCSACREETALRIAKSVHMMDAASRAASIKPMSPIMSR